MRQTGAIVNRARRLLSYSRHECPSLGLTYRSDTLQTIYLIGQVGNGQAQDGVHRFRGQFGQRDQSEGPKVQAGVGDVQVRLVNHTVPIEQAS